jgi:hypothetical protein
MNLKKLAIGAVAALGITAAPVQASAQIDNDMIQQIAIMLLADKLGIDAGGILGALGGSSANVFDMAPAIAMQQYAPQTSAEQIWRLRQSGLPWDQVATRAGVPADRYVVLRNSGNLDRNTLWRNTYQSRLNLSTGTINNLRRMGLSWDDIAKAAVIARESRVSIYDVAEHYRRSHNWNAVANRYKVTNGDVRQRVQTWRTSRAMPIRWTKDTAKASVRSVTTGKALGHSKAKSSKGNAGKSNGKGNGKSKGKGKGKGKH